MKTKALLTSWLIPSALLIASSANAAISHRDCTIVANWDVTYPQIGTQLRSDWSRLSAIERLFERLGYESRPAQDYRTLPDGTLFTHAVSAVGARNRSRRQAEFFTYTILSIKIRDTRAPEGFRILSVSRSNPQGAFYVDANQSLIGSMRQALELAPACRIER